MMHPTKKRTEIEENKTGMLLSAKEDLRSILIDSLPFIALVLNKKTREIVACNKTASDAGAEIGKTCFETIPKGSHVCHFCKAPVMLKSGKEQSLKTEYKGRHWEGRWLPYSDDYYIHYIWDRTELVETREELQESRQKISDALEFSTKILNSSSIGILAYHKSGKCITANAAAAKIAGTSVEILLEQNFHELSSWKESGLYQAALDSLDTGIDQTIEVHGFSSFGREAWLITSFSSFYSKGEQHLLLMISDISERKKAEDLLRTSESRFKSIFDSNFISIAFWSVKGEILDANDSFLNLIGYTRDDLIRGNVNWAKMTPPEYALQDSNTLKELREHGICTPIEKEYIRKDGSRIHIMLGAALIEGINQGGVTYVLDISKRKKAEKALHESEKALKETSHYARNLIESSLDPLVTIDSMGKITDVNAATEKATGYKRKKLIGSEFAVYFTEPDLAEKGYKAVFLKGTVRDYPLTLLHKTGRTREVLFNATVFKNTLGDVQGVFAAARDITELRKMEEALRESKESLEKLNDHLVEIRENERALIARDLHDQLGQSLTALKLDINMIKGFVNSDPDAILLLNKMVSNVSNLITDTQRITADLRPGILDDLGLVSAIEWYCDEFNKRTGIRCRLNLGNAAYPDPKKRLIFFRALQEALTNVIRHSNATLVKITFKQSANGTTLSIQDNGIGITKEQAESGKSLGLAGIRERIKHYKGILNISSREGAGTKLNIFIPGK